MNLNTDNHLRAVPLRAQIWIALSLLISQMSFIVSATAATLYVDNQLPSDCQGTYSIANRNCSGSGGDAYNTIREAANVAVAGDSVLIRSGTYNEVIEPQNSGVEGHPIIFKTYNGENVHLTGSTSIYGTTVGPIALDSKKYIIIDGFTISNTPTFAILVGSDHCIVRNNHFSDGTAAGQKSGIYLGGSDYNKIMNNRIDHSAQDNMGFTLSNFNIVENNIFIDAPHDLMTIRCSSFNVFRNNYFANSLTGHAKASSFMDCNVNTMSKDFLGPFQGPPITNSTKYNLIENNKFALVDCNPINIATCNAIQFSAQNTIMRKNLFYNNAGGALGMKSSPTAGDGEAQYNEHNRVYNNVFYNNEWGAIFVRDVGYYHDNIFKNNILFNNTGDSGNTPGQILHQFDYDISESLFSHNNIIHDVAGENVIERYRGSASYPTGTLSYYQTNYSAAFDNTNLEVDPLFVNASAHDFNLQSTSSMIDAGTFLTNTVGAGSGISMAVNDAGYFYDGFGIDGEVGDLIQLDGQTKTARIVDIEYDTDILTLDQSLTWTPGQGVSLAYSGDAPDIGVYEYGVTGIIGDFCGENFGPPDGYVDLWDLMLFADHWHTTIGDSNWDSKFDLTGPSFGDLDDYIDVWDLMVYAEHWHEGVKGHRESEIENIKAKVIKIQTHFSAQNHSFDLGNVAPEYEP